MVENEKRSMKTKKPLKVDGPGYHETIRLFLEDNAQDGVVLTCSVKQDGRTYSVVVHNKMGWSATSTGPDFGDMLATTIGSYNEMKSAMERLARS